MTEESKDFTQAEFVEKVDVLTIENFYLKLQNGQMQLRELDRSKAGLIEDLKETQQQLEVARKALEVKYGCPIKMDTVGKDGRIKRPAKPIPDSIAVQPNGTTG